MTTELGRFSWTKCKSTNHKRKVDCTLKLRNWAQLEESIESENTSPKLEEEIYNTCDNGFSGCIYIKNWKINSTVEKVQISQKGKHIADKLWKDDWCH